MASALLSATVQHLQTSAGEQGEGSALLQHINTLENIYQREPLKLVATCKQILQGEKKAVMEEVLWFLTPHIPAQLSGTLA